MTTTSRPTDRAAFSDRVMATVERLPTPTVTRALDIAARERSLTDVRGALGVAWHLATRARTAPRLVRVQAMGLVVIVSLALSTTATLAGAAAVRVAEPIVRSAIGDHPADDARVLVPPAQTPTPSPTPGTPAATTPADDLQRVANPAISGPVATGNDEDADDVSDSDADGERDGGAEDEDATDHDRRGDDPEDADEAGGDHDDADEEADADEDADEAEDADEDGDEADEADSGADDGTDHDDDAEDDGGGHEGSDDGGSDGGGD